MLAITADRLKAMLGRLVQAALPRVDYLGHYRAKVNAQSSDGATLDVTPDDTRFPPMSKIPLRLGIPSAVALVQVGAFVLVGFDAGDPSKPYCHLWDGGESVTKLVLNGTVVILGAESGSDFVALAQKVLDNLNALKTHFTILEGILNTPINEPGNGAPSAFQAAIQTGMTGHSYPSPTSVAAAQAKAK